MGETCESGECCSGEQKQCCGSKECSCSSCCSKESQCGAYDKFGMMMCLAKEAKMELLKEKMKKKFEALHGKKLDRIADFIVEAMHEHKMAGNEMMKKAEESREKFYALLHEE
mgnify:FL=1